jgi:hypothetical protein
MEKERREKDGDVHREARCRRKRKMANTRSLNRLAM